MDDVIETGSTSLSKTGSDNRENHMGKCMGHVLNNVAVTLWRADGPHSSCN